MDTVKVDILNPKARKLLKDLADLKLIAIREPQKEGLAGVLNKLRSHSELAPDPAEIAKEVEAVRTSRYAK
ncbi:MAG: hypothetical protein WD267_02200 [Balneolales bacterium]